MIFISEVILHITLSDPQLVSLSFRSVQRKASIATRNTCLSLYTKEIFSELCYQVNYKMQPNAQLVFTCLLILLLCIDRGYCDGKEY